MSDVELAVDGGVARVLIDRPAVLNALTPQTTRELRAIWERIEGDDMVRVVVLTGSGDRAFCVGADMSETGAEGAERDLDYWAEASPDGFGAIALRATLDVPVIARVNGFALGGGLEMVLGCDLVVAAEHAEFGFPEPRVGRMPLDGGMVLLPRLMSHAWAMDLLLTGRRIGATEAHRRGLVNTVVRAHRLDEAVDDLIEELLACAPGSLRAIKRVVRDTRHLPVAEAHAMRLPALIAALHSGEAEEGVRAFREKRPPAWVPRAQGLPR